MRNRRRVSRSLVVLVLAAAPASAQLFSAKDGPVVYSHHHLSAADVPTQTKFWTTLGGVPVKLGGGVDAIRFPNVYIMVAAKAPTGGSKGSTMDHLGLQVTDLAALLAKVRAAGYPVVTEAELPAGIKGEMKDGIFTIAQANLKIAFVMGPEGSKLELLETPGLAWPVALHHLHFAALDVAPVKAWYDKVFGAKIPGVSLLFQASGAAPVPSKGRTADHIGFEVKDLEAFCKRLEGMGVTFDRPYAMMPAAGVGLAFLTDPFGTTIELSEGLKEIQ